MDLFMKIDLNLNEALCGFKKTIKTLDNRVLVIQSHPGLKKIKLILNF